MGLGAHVHMASPWMARIIAGQTHDRQSGHRKCLVMAGSIAAARLAMACSCARAADTAALIEHLRFGPYDVIGYSLGGYIAQQLAVTHPGLVRRLALLAGAGAAPTYALARSRAAVDLARASTRSRPASTSPTCSCRSTRWPSSNTTTTRSRSLSA